MGLDYIVRAFNYGTTQVYQAADRIANNHSATKKCFQLIRKSIALSNYYQGTDHYSELSKNLKGAVEFIEFYSFYGTIVEWINPFCKESIDKEAFKTSLKTFLSTQPVLINSTSEDAEKVREIESISEEINQVIEAKVETVTRKVFDKVMSKSFYSQQEAQEVLRKALRKNGIDVKRKEIQAVKIEQKTRSVTEFLTLACFTVADGFENLEVLKRLQIVDAFAIISNKIGTETPVYAFIAKIGSDMVVGVFTTAGLILVFGGKCGQVAKAYSQLQESSNDEERANAKKQLVLAVLDAAATGLDVVTAGAPLVLTVNPPLLLTLSIVSKGTAIICFLNR